MKPFTQEELEEQYHEWRCEIQASFGDDIQIPTFEQWLAHNEHVQKVIEKQEANNTTTMKYYKDLVADKDKHYVACTKVRVGDVDKVFGTVTKIRNHEGPNILGSDISLITFTFDSGEKYTASAEFYSPEDVPFLPPVRQLQVKSA